MASFTKEDLHDIFGFGKKGDKSAQADENDVYEDMMNNCDIPFEQKVAQQVHPILQKINDSELVCRYRPEKVEEKIEQKKEEKHAHVSRDDGINPEGVKQAYGPDVKTQPTGKQLQEAFEEYDSIDNVLVKQNKQIQDKKDIEALISNKPKNIVDETVNKLLSSIKEEKVVQKIKEIKIEQVKMTTEKENEVKTESQQEFDINNWWLKSPNPKFAKLYFHKKIAIQDTTRGNRLPFDQYRSDLISAKVDTNIGIYDVESVLKKIIQNQQWRDRIKEIQLNINSQYYKFKRYLQMLRGLVMNIEKVSPAAAYEGLYLQHLGDMQAYMADLEVAHENAKTVMTNLSAAWESLSRQLTIATQGRVIENVYNQQNINNGKIVKYGAEKENINKTEMNEFISVKEQKEKKVESSSIDDIL